MIQQQNPDANTCPLCGGDNRCAMAAAAGTGATQEQEAASQCWCMSEEFPAGLQQSLNDLPGPQRCICQQCLASYREKHYAR